MNTAPTPTRGAQERPTKAVQKSRRQEKRRQEEHRRVAQHRRRQLIVRITLLVLALAVLGGIGLAIRAATSPPAPLAGSDRPASPRLPGLQGTAASWQPEYSALAQRVAALRFPPSGTESFHIHALLHVYVNGHPVPVPAQIGLTPSSEAPMHTHDTTGIIHMEAAYPFAFRLSDVFNVWGVSFSPTQLGSYTNNGKNRVYVYVNGHPIANTMTYALKARDNIVVAYGKRGSFPTAPPADSLNGL